MKTQRTYSQSTQIEKKTVITEFDVSEKRYKKEPLTGNLKGQNSHKSFVIK